MADLLIICIILHLSLFQLYLDLVELSSQIFDASFRRKHIAVNYLLVLTFNLCI